MQETSKQLFEKKQKQKKPTDHFAKAKKSKTKSKKRQTGHTYLFGCFFSIFSVLFSLFVSFCFFRFVSFCRWPDDRDLRKMWTTRGTDQKKTTKRKENQRKRKTERKKETNAKKKRKPQKKCKTRTKSGKNGFAVVFFPFGGVAFFVVFFSLFWLILPVFPSSFFFQIRFGGYFSLVSYFLISFDKSCLQAV